MLFEVFFEKNCAYSISNIYLKLSKCSAIFFMASSNKCCSQFLFLLFYYDGFLDQGRSALLEAKSNNNFFGFVLCWFVFDLSVKNRFAQFITVQLVYFRFYFFSKQILNYNKFLYCVYTVEIKIYELHIYSCI